MMKPNMMKVSLLACVVTALLVPVQGFAAKATMSAASDLATVKKEIEGGADINGKYRCSPQLGCITYLSRAVFRGETEAIQYLLTKGADVNAVGMFDLPPIVTAAMAGQPGIVEMLLAAKADLNMVITVDKEKYTAREAALMSAKKEGGQATDPAVKERYEKTIKLLEK